MKKCCLRPLAAVAFPVCRYLPGRSIAGETPSAAAAAAGPTWQAGRANLQEEALETLEKNQNQIGIWKMLFFLKIFFSWDF